MSGIQATVILEHGRLIVEHPKEKPVRCIVPEGQIGQQVNSGRDQHEEDDAKENGVPDAGYKTGTDQPRGEGTVSISFNLTGKTVFPVPAIQG